MFDAQTGVYLPAPHKRRKTVDRLGIGNDDGLVWIYPNPEDKYPTYIACLVRVVLQQTTRIIVETENSLYEGKPS